MDDSPHSLLPAEDERREGARFLYLQMKQALIARIASGEWQPGDLLPSEQALAAEYGVAQGTARKAVDHLVAEKLAIRRHGKGTYVATHDWQRALSQFFRLVGDDGSNALPEARVISHASGVATVQEAARLKLRGNAKVIRFLRVRTFDAVPVIVEHIVLPFALFRALSKETGLTLPPALYEHFGMRFGILVREVSENLRAVTANPEDAALLGIEPGSPLLEIDRVVISVQSKPVEWRISRCHTARHSYLNRID
jgi:GntR family transcriptional regulator